MFYWFANHRLKRTHYCQALLLSIKITHFHVGLFLFAGIVLFVYNAQQLDYSNAIITMSAEGALGNALAAITVIVGALYLAASYFTFDVILFDYTYSPKRLITGAANVAAAVLQRTPSGTVVGSSPRGTSERPFSPRVSSLLRIMQQQQQQQQPNLRTGSGRTPTSSPNRQKRQSSVITDNRCTRPIKRRLTTAAMIGKHQQPTKLACEMQAKTLRIYIFFILVVIAIRFMHFFFVLWEAANNVGYISRVAFTISLAVYLAASLALEAILLLPISRHRQRLVQRSVLAADEQNQPTHYRAPSTATASSSSRLLVQSAAGRASNKQRRLPVITTSEENASPEFVTVNLNHAAPTARANERKRRSDSSRASATKRKRGHHSHELARSHSPEPSHSPASSSRRSHRHHRHHASTPTKDYQQVPLTDATDDTKVDKSAVAIQTSATLAATEPPAKAASFLFDGFRRAKTIFSLRKPPQQQQQPPQKNPETQKTVVAVNAERHEGKHVLHRYESLVNAIDVVFDDVVDEEAAKVEQNSTNTKKTSFSDSTLRRSQSAAISYAESASVQTSSNSVRSEQQPSRPSMQTTAAKATSSLKNFIPEPSDSQHRLLLLPPDGLSARTSTHSADKKISRTSQQLLPQRLSAEAQQRHSEAVELMPLKANSQRPSSMLPTIQEQRLSEKSDISPRSQEVHGVDQTLPQIRRSASSGVAQSASPNLDAAPAYTGRTSTESVKSVLRPSLQPVPPTVEIARQHSITVVQQPSLIVKVIKQPSKLIEPVRNVKWPVTSDKDHSDEDDEQQPLMSIRQIPALDSDNDGNDRLRVEPMQFYSSRNSLTDLLQSHAVSEASSTISAFSGRDENRQRASNSLPRSNSVPLVPVDSSLARLSNEESTPLLLDDVEAGLAKPLPTTATTTAEARQSSVHESHVFASPSASEAIIMPSRRDSLLYMTGTF